MSTPTENQATPIVQPLRFTGERFVGGAGVEITYDHLLRYFFALQFVQGKQVLDIASGEGYGAALLANSAAQVDAFDLEPQAVAHARAKYAQRINLRFQAGSAPQFLAAVPAQSYDVVTAFEFIEHVSMEDQRQVLEEVRRVLKPGGLLLISTPDKRLYTDVTLSKNPFHVRELYRPEFEELLGAYFSHMQVLEQSCFTGSAIFDNGASRATLAQMVWTNLTALEGHCRPGLQGSGTYLVAVAGNQPLSEQQPVVLVDLARKLIGEHLYQQHLELERLKGVEAELERTRKLLEERTAEPQRAQQVESQLSQELAAEKRNVEQHQQILDRLLAQLARQHDEMTQLRRLQSEVAQLRESANHYDVLRQQEIARRTHLERMLSVRLALRAKRYLDRAPRLKELLRNAVQRVASPNG
jgi:ubiquinone/menaquinone biosynthesis C-methylase UbiE